MSGIARYCVWVRVELGSIEVSTRLVTRHCPVAFNDFRELHPRRVSQNQPSTHSGEFRIRSAASYAVAEPGRLAIYCLISNNVVCGRTPRARFDLGRHI